MRSFPNIIILSIGILLFTTCEESGEESGVTFSRDIQPIFNVNCALSGCHVIYHETGLDLRQGESYANLVSVPSKNNAPRKRVVPGDPDSSVLYLKVTGDPSTGDRMPLDASPLGSAPIDDIKTWIFEGAENN